MQLARRNVRIARYAIGVSAAAALAAFAAVARASHPGTAHPSRASSAVSAEDTSSDDDNAFFGDDFSSSGSYSNIGPSGSAAPQIQSGGS